jgi:hypothetical protein
MKLKRGELSFEFLIGMAFLAVFLTTLMAVFKFYHAQNPKTVAVIDIADNYRMILDSLRTDSRLAASMKMLNNGVELYKNNKLFATYQVLNANLYRTEADGKGSILISNLERAAFKKHPQLDNLLLVTLLPADKMKIPFFTSFALRGKQGE